MARLTKKYLRYAYRMITDDLKTLTTRGVYGRDEDDQPIDYNLEGVWDHLVEERLRIARLHNGRSWPIKEVENEP